MGAGATGTVVVLGAGAWGSALAHVFGQAGNRVVLVARSEEFVQQFNLHHRNGRYLGDLELSPNIRASVDTGVLEAADLVVLALPAQATRGALQALAEHLKRAVPVIVTAKGFERKTLALQTGILADEWHGAIPLVLSGPSFAHDAAGGKPTAVTLAGVERGIVQAVADRFAGSIIRPYVSDDLLGVQMCGGLKNVYALASGAIEGAGLGLSARSAFISRALAEMERLVEAAGGRVSTVHGLAGMGDLVLSCTSSRSRNYAFGMALGEGRSPAQLLEGGVGLAEGVASAPVALGLARAGNVSVPLVEAVNRLLEGRDDIARIVESLMIRPLKAER